MLLRPLRRPSPAMVVAMIALFIALDGPAAAKRVIDGGSIRRNSITSKQVRNGSLSIADLTRRSRAALERTPVNSVGARQLQPKAVTGDKLADKAVGTRQLGDGVVGGAQLADHAVTTAHLADGLVGPGQLAAGAVTASKLGDGSIGADAVADGSLRTTDIGDFAGAVQVNFSAFAANSCQSNKRENPITPAPTAPDSTSVISDDVILVTGPVGWPDQLLVTGNPGAGNTLRIIVCNPTADPIAVPDGVRPVFQYVAIDQP